MVQTSSLISNERKEVSWAYAKTVTEKGWIALGTTWKRDGREGKTC